MLKRLVGEGVTEEELNQARRGYLQRQVLLRSSDGQLVGLLNRNLFIDRTMDYYAELDEKIAKVSGKEVHAALKKYLELKRLVVVTAGDFKE